MDGKGRVLYNIFIERFWCLLKQKKINLILIILNTVKEVKNPITDYIICYNNNKKMHQSLKYLIPEQIYLTKIIG